MSDFFINIPPDDAAEVYMPLKQAAVPQRPKTAVSNVCASRPGSACRPQSARAGMLSREHQVLNVWQPAGVQGIADISKTSRPATAAAPHTSKKAALAALKAQLSDVAAGSNMQLQSLRPSMAPVDASTALQAQVLEQLANLDASLTYTQARTTAAAHLDQPSTQPVEPQEPAPLSPAATTSHGLQTAISKRSTASMDQHRQPRTEHALSHALSVSGGNISRRDPEAVMAAAAEALADMRHWAVDQELSMMEPSAAARYASKALAAHVSMLQSEALVLEYQRQHFEAELARLKARPGFGQSQQEHSEQQPPVQQRRPHKHLSIRANLQAAVGVEPSNAHSFAGWASSHNYMASSADAACSNMDGPGSETDDSTDAYSCSSRSSSDLGGSMHANEGESTGRSAGPHAKQYIGSEALMRIPSGDQQCVGNTLQMAHVGLGPQHLDKVQAALEAAAAPVRHLDLSSNMLTDNAVHDLVQMLQTLHAASDISKLNLSHNQLLTGQCCGPLGQLLSMAAGSAAQPNRDRRGSIHSKDVEAQPSAPVGSSDCCQANMDSTAGSVQAGGSNEPVVGMVPPVVCVSKTGSNCPADPAGSALPQPSFRQLLQPLQLQVLLLEGVALGDRGAAALAGALSGTQHLQVLDLSRCGIKDSGGAAICTALQQQDSVRELHLSWNALANMTAKALEALLRRATCSISTLQLSHCGLGDRDGSLILNALGEAATSRMTGSADGGSSSGMHQPCSWRLLDLSHNSLEGGAALCVSALVAAEASTITAAWADAAHKNSAAGGSTCGSSRRPGCSNKGCSVTCGVKCVNLDGNPLGASGIQILMRAIASQPSVCAHGKAAGSAASPSSGGKLDGNCPANGAAMCSAQCGGTTEYFLPLQQLSGQHDGQLQPAVAQVLPIHVSIAKVSLLAKEKGFRCSMRATEAAQVFTSQVPTLAQAVAVPSKPQAKGITKAPPSKGVPPPSPVAAAAAAASCALSVVRETAAGFNLYCPAGQYQLSLKHPASKHMFDQLLLLRTQQQQLLQQVKAQQQQQQQQQQQSAAAASREPHQSGSPAAARASVQSRRASRADIPVRADLNSIARAASSNEPGKSNTSGIASRRVSQSASALAVRATAKPAPKQRVQSCVVDVPNLDIKLDGKATKLEQLLSLAPWYKAQPAAVGQPVPPGEEADLAALNSSSGGAAAGAGGGGSKAQAGKKKPKIPRVLELNVKAAAVLHGREPPVMPPGLLQWAIEVLCDTSCGDVWKLQLLELLLQDWLLLPQQAVQLLNVFDRDLGQDEQLLAAGLVWAQLVQPMQLWDEVLPATLRPSQQKQFKRMIGPALMALDRQNLTGPYSLDLANSIHRAVARRLQLAALLDAATSECRYYLSWRNASLNGKPLSEDALAHLQLYAIPSSGTLKLDYVSYQTPDASLAAVAQAQLQGLLANLRQLQLQYSRLVLSLREEYFPGGGRRSVEEAKAAALKARECKDGVRLGKTSSAALGGNKPAQHKAAGAGLDAAQSPEPASAAAAVALPANRTAAPTQADRSQLVVPGGVQQPAWWAASGFDASELLWKYQPRPPSAAAAAAQSTRQSRRATRDAAGGKKASVLGSRRQSSASRPVSATTPNRRPSTPANAPTRAAASPAPAAAAGAGEGTAVSGSRKASGPTAAGGKAPSGAQQEGSSSRLSQGVTDEQLLARLLAAAAPASAAAVFACMGTNHAVSVLKLLAGKDKGPAAVAALLECLSPVVAARFLRDLPGHETSLLPAAVRAAVQPLLPPAVAECIQEVAGALKEASRQRDSQQLLCVRRWASQVAGLTCSQLTTVLQLLGVQGQVRCGVIVALWSKLLDRHNLVKVFEALSGAEQLGLMAALGSYYVWSSLGAPDGLHFRLNLTEPEQRDVAREVVKVAVRRTMAAGKGSGVQHLRNFTAEGKPVADPEDDKLWLSMESKHTLLEFDFARTWQQELHITESAVKRIQRAWRRRAALHGSRSNTSLISLNMGLHADAASADCVHSLHMGQAAEREQYGMGGGAPSGWQARPSSSPSPVAGSSSYMTDSYSSCTYYSSAELSGSVSLYPCQGLADLAGPHSSISGCGLSSITVFQDPGDSCSGNSGAGWSGDGQGVSSPGSVPGAASGGHCVDLGAGLAAFKLSGVVSASLEPTPRLMGQ